MTALLRAYERVAAEARKATRDCGYGYESCEEENVDLAERCDQCRLYQALRDLDALRAKPVREPSKRRIPDAVPRTPGCRCHWEEGDSPCPVHVHEDDQQPQPSGKKGGAFESISREPWPPGGFPIKVDLEDDQQPRAAVPADGKPYFILSPSAFDGLQRATEERGAAVGLALADAAAGRCDGDHAAPPCSSSECWRGDERGACGCGHESQRHGRSCGVNPAGCLEDGCPCTWDGTA